MKILQLVFILFFTCFSLKASAVFDFMTSPSLEKGARVYKDRCVLCHSQNGKSEGLLSTSVLKLPKPDLLDNKYSRDEYTLRYIIIWGGFQNKMNAFSPPWGNVLTWDEIESLLKFIKHLREHNEQAVALLQNSFVTSTVDIKVGQSIFNKRCTICHGETGMGNGRLAKLIKTPPFDFAQNQLTDDQLKEKVMKGGGDLSRSRGMPAWEGQLSNPELDSLVLYLKSFR